jgi:hypothetical protein
VSTVNDIQRVAKSQSIEEIRVSHQSFVDWMKAVGMLLIVVGHVVGDPFSFFNLAAQPVYTKQLGVAFFIFVIGWSLSNQKESGFHVVFNRLFPVYFYGLIGALVMSAIVWSSSGDINESNYAPFFLGANVVLNYVPANASTWYIGTYIHLILFWYFVMKGRELRLGHIIIAFIFENIVRSSLLVVGQDFTAYMILPNWLTVFLIGMYLYDRKDLPFSPLVFLYVFGWAALIFLWVWLSDYFVFDKVIPFRGFSEDHHADIVVRSVLISFVYVSHTLFFFSLARYLPKLGLVSFFARNTLIIFIGHLPFILAFHPYLYSFFELDWLKRCVLIAIAYVGFACLSELIQRVVPLRSIREKVWVGVEPVLTRLGMIRKSS